MEASWGLAAWEQKPHHAVATPYRRKFRTGVLVARATSAADAQEPLQDQSPMQQEECHAGPQQIAKQDDQSFMQQEECHAGPQQIAKPDQEDELDNMGDVDLQHALQYALGPACHQEPPGPFSPEPQLELVAQPGPSSALICEPAPAAQPGPSSALICEPTHAAPSGHKEPISFRAILEEFMQDLDCERFTATSPMTSSHLEPTDLEPETNSSLEPDLEPARPIVIVIDDDAEDTNPNLNVHERDSARMQGTLAYA